MDMASGNEVERAHGIGIICLDHSMCEIEHNTIAGAQVDGTARSEPPGRRDRVATSTPRRSVTHNTVIASPGGVQAFDNSTITRD